MGPGRQQGRRDIKHPHAPRPPRTKTLMALLSIRHSAKETHRAKHCYYAHAPARDLLSRLEIASRAGGSLPHTIHRPSRMCDACQTKHRARTRCGEGKRRPRPQNPGVRVIAYLNTHSVGGGRARIGIGITQKNGRTWARAAGDTIENAKAKFQDKEGHPARPAASMILGLTTACFMIFYLRVALVAWSSRSMSCSHETSITTSTILKTYRTWYYGD